MVPCISHPRREMMSNLEPNGAAGTFSHESARTDESGYHVEITRGHG
jgi:hypothetical protein